jgi:sodium-dependent dicarboxylate transporter 2/3/5
MFKEFTGRDMGFFQLLSMLPISIIMIFVIWVCLMIFLKPEKKTIPGLKEKVKELAKEIGPMTGPEKFVIATVALVVLLMGAQAFVPALQGIDRAAIMLIGTLIFFLFRILTVKELEDMPWNIILLFGGAMSVGFCLWKSGGAQWLAIEWLALFQKAHWLVFVCSVAFFVLVTTNFIMNVAAIALSLPISLVVAGYMGVSPEVIVYASLVTAGQPFVLLIGAAPNAIAYGSGQFSAGEFFKHGLIPSIVLMIVLAAAIYFLWPILGMPVLVK